MLLQEHLEICNIKVESHFQGKYTAPEVFKVWGHTEVIVVEVCGPQQNWQSDATEGFLSFDPKWTETPLKPIP